MDKIDNGDLNPTIGRKVIYRPNIDELELITIPTTMCIKRHLGKRVVEQFKQPLDSEEEH